MGNYTREEILADGRGGRRRVYPPPVYRYVWSNLKNIADHSKRASKSPG